MSAYDSIAELYDPWSVSVVEDVAFYVEEAERAGGPVVELAVGTGRIAVPTAAAGIQVIGVDSSTGMLEVCRARAELAGVADLLDLRFGELEAPPVEERVGLVTCPFRSFLHLPDDDARLARAAGSAGAARAGRTARIRRLRPEPGRTSPTRTAAGSSASRRSTSARTGTRRRGR